MHDTCRTEEGKEGRGAERKNKKGGKKGERKKILMGDAHDWADIISLLFSFCRQKLFHQCNYQIKEDGKEVQPF